MKVVALAAIVRKNNKGIQILTQIRNVLNPEYDPLYDKTIEICGESMEKEESIIDTAIRGCFEEAGCPYSSIIKIIGGSGKVYSTREEDKILGIEPYYFVQQLRGPQPWIGPCFVVIVDEDFEPLIDPEKPQEAFNHRWLSPEELLHEALSHPERFMGLHFLFLLKLCEDIVSGKMNI